MKIRTFRKMERDSCCGGDSSPSSCCGGDADTQPVSVSPSCSCSDDSGEIPDDSPPCCGPRATCTGGEISDRLPGFLGWIQTPAGRVPRVATTLTIRDHLGTWKVRWGIGRMTYAVPAGLYGVGEPDAGSPVIVTCNYRMTWNLVRRALHGRSAWILALQTYGVNVWCAAGKGTFGTAELLRRIESTSLASVVSHRRLILPILGAVGVSAHRVARQSGFSVTYATIRADDLPRWFDAGMVTTPDMRRLTFTLRERAVLVPVELIQGVKQMFWVVVPAAASAGLLTSPGVGAVTAAGLLGAMACGTTLGPILLPLLPFRYFSANGALLGVIWSLILWWGTGGVGHVPEWLGFSSILASVSGYYLLAFTGCTPFTSRTGVKREMRRALPLMAGGVIAGVIAVVAGVMLGKG